MNTRQYDLVIFGGGIAGLWALARARQAGYNAILLETHTVGGVQSIASQGIIHGGTKYALTGKLTGAAQAIGEMPGIWRDCLQGKGEIDLSAATVLTENQLLWSTGSLASGMAGFFAGKVMQSRMQTVEKNGYPDLFRSGGFTGSLYQLAEPVLDTRSVMQALYEPLQDVCYQIAMSDLVWLGDNSFEINGVGIIKSHHIALMAGAGNEALLHAMGRDKPKMQRRPLQMVMLRGDLPETYAHCLGASANPRLTITSGRDADNQVVWYLGGQVAENGVGLGLHDQVAAGRKELAEVLPWIDFANTEWTTLNIDRAEPLMPGGKRPDDCFIDSRDRIHTCWPTKLAFAPRLAKLLIEQLKGAISPSGEPSGQLPLPPPDISAQPWNEDRTWI